ncbi:hypothetical protein J8F10_10380 [Gemmata sp. G18]|uniref:Uncharacterized protein n=1 Tax=Gemmata palustris TaxID=2822762 RepID=A0ABS5BPM8_9BACT|nr:hypothetical protein [Gemmata palustris]MBP3955687.1 hypothetical protein [Gemmata palustris]
MRSLRVDVRCFDESIEREYLVARVAVDHILWGDAIADGESLFRICDNDSQGLHELHVILTDGTNNIRDDFGGPGPDFVLHLRSQRGVSPGRSTVSHPGTRRGLQLVGRVQFGGDVA